MDNQPVEEWFIEEKDLKGIPTFERKKVNPNSILGFGYDMSHDGKRRIFACLEDGSVVYDIDNVIDNEDDPCTVSIRMKCINVRSVLNDKT